MLRVMRSQPVGLEADREHFLHKQNTPAPVNDVWVGWIEASAEVSEHKLLLSEYNT